MRRESLVTPASHDGINARASCLQLAREKSGRKNPVAKAERLLLGPRESLGRLAHVTERLDLHIESPL